MRKKIEFIYDKKSDKTLILIWQGMRLLEKRELNGQTDKEHQDRIKEDIKNEDWED